MSAALAEITSGLEPIGLDDLVREAELLTRVDRKYVMSAAAMAPVVSGLDPRTRILHAGGSAASPYETMYFDTPELLSYRLAAHGRRRRFKLRSRLYADTDTAFLEMKTRGGRGATIKERIPYPSDANTRLTSEGRSYAGQALETLGLSAQVSDALIPTLRTSYRRTTLLLVDGARATIDTDLQWHDREGRRLAPDQLVIVETKSASRASVLDRLLWHHGIRPVGISKFATGLAALRPDLPSNKWSRVLRRYLVAPA